MSLLTFIYSTTDLVLQVVEPDQTADLGQLMEPDPLAFTFDTPGWYVLGVILIVSLAFLTYKRASIYRKNAYRREALERVKKLETEQLPESKKILGLHVVLKQVAMITYGREQVAALYGEKWLAFLDSKTSGKGFVASLKFFDRAIYSEADIDEKDCKKMYKLSKNWIHGHS